VLPAVNALQNLTTNCTRTVSSCTRLQQGVTAAMQACNQDPNALLGKLKSLTGNQADAVKVQAKIDGLVNSANAAGRKKAARQAGATCGSIAASASTYLDALSANPASTLLPGLAAPVINAPAVTCTAADLPALRAVATKLAEIVPIFQTLIATAQNSLASKKAAGVGGNQAT
jgi:hypothetical protein